MASFSSMKTENLYIGIRFGSTDMVRCALADPEVVVNGDDYIIPAHWAPYKEENLSPFLFACARGDAHVIDLFLACQRDINYNAKSRSGYGALHLAFWDPDCVESLLDDARIDAWFMRGSCTMLHSDIDKLPSIKVLMAHDRFDASFLSMKSNCHETPFEEAKNRNMTELAELYQRYINYPIGTKAKLRAELGYSPYDAGELFAIAVLLCDNYLELK